MAECCDDDPTTRYRHQNFHRSPDDDEAEESASAAAHMFGGSFQFIVQEQAKSMVAIQELQQEVGSLLLFRQAVLAALPHLQQTKVINKAGQSWTRRKQHLQQYRSLQQQQDGGTEQPAATTTTTTTTHHNSNGVVDSGFSTENSNTSPRSSRFDTSSSEMMTTMPPMEKELVQHLERVQQRLARLKKDEDRLLTLLNVNSHKRSSSSNVMSQETVMASSDELWLLLEEIQLRSQAIRNNTTTTKDTKPEEETTVQQPMSHKKRVSFQQQQQQLENKTENVGVVVAPDATTLPSPKGEASRYQPPTRDQVAAILRLTNPVQLQRHLLRALLDIQNLREQVEAGRTDVASRDAQWRTNSQLAVEQMTQLKDENEDLRFQLEEQKIELEGTKARLRMLNRPPVTVTTTTPALTSVRVRAASTQTDQQRPTYLPVPSTTTKGPSRGTQTDPLTEDNNNKMRALPRVVDASPKLTKFSSKLTDLTGRGSGSWDEEDRPSVERRSYSSRIPTPIKPTVIPVVTSSNKTTSSVITTPSKRELPDIPSKIKSPATPAGKNHHQRGGAYVSSKSDPAKVRVTVVTAGSSPHQRVRTRLALTDSFSSSEEQPQQQQQLDGKVDDYFDSINANSRIKNRSPYLHQQQQHSPVDSLERSFPSVGINYHYHRQTTVSRDNRSYNSQSSAGSSTTPSNSLPYHP